MWSGLPNNSLHSLTAFLRNEPDSVAAMLKSPSAVTIGKAFYLKKWGHGARYLNLVGLYPALEMMRSRPPLSSIYTIHWWFTSNTRTSPSPALYFPCKARLALSKGGCYTQITSTGKGLAILLKSHSTSLGLFWGSSHGFPRGNDGNKLSVDLNYVLASIKVMLISVASIIPTNAVAEFFPQIPPLFLAPFIVKKVHVAMLLSSEILCAHIPWPYQFFSPPPTSLSWTWWFWQVLLPILCSKQNSIKES